MKRIFILNIIVSLFFNAVYSQSKKPFFECCCGKNINYNEKFYHFEESNNNEIYITTSVLDNVTPNSFGYYIIAGKSYAKGETCSQSMKMKMFHKRTCAENCYNTYYSKKYTLIDEPKYGEALVGLLSFFLDSPTSTSNEVQSKKITNKQNGSNQKAKESVTTLEKSPTYTRTFASVEDVLTKGIIIKKGMEGVVVSELKKKLLDKGIKKVTEIKSASEIFDDTTEQAVKEFQKKYSLPETGVVDAETMRILNMREYIINPSMETRHVNSKAGI